MKKLTTLSLVALVVAAFSTPTFASLSDGTDLVLGFTIDDGAAPGNGQDVEIDLGSNTQFTLTSTYTYTGTSLATTLSGLYGSSYDTRGDLVFNVVGNTVANGGNATFDTPNFDATENSSNPLIGLATGYSTTTGAILNEEKALVQVGSPVPGTNPSSLDGLETSGGPAPSGDGAGQYEYFPETSVAGGSYSQADAIINGATTIALYQFNRGTSAEVRNGAVESELGVFTLGTNGSFSYQGLDAAAVPEPSTWALMLGGAGFLFLAVRRRWMSDLN